MNYQQAEITIKWYLGNDCTGLSQGVDIYFK